VVRKFRDEALLAIAVDRADGRALVNQLVIRCFLPAALQPEILQALGQNLAHRLPAPATHAGANGLLVDPKNGVCLADRTQVIIRVHGTTLFVANGKRRHAGLLRC
jgi:hypothetical protein